jgi:hypothetical protein
MAKADLTAARLRELLHYDPETGIFTVKIATSSRSRKGGQPGNLHPQGYLKIGLDRKLYSAHRLAWLYMTSEWPTHNIDHINGVRHDNRWINLRDVSTAVNTQNHRIARKTSRCGFLGVVPKGSRWGAKIKLDRSAMWLGTYDTPEEAHAVYLEAKRRLHEGCTI